MAVALTPGRSSAPPGDDVPRSIVVRASTGDRIFRGILRGGGLFVLFITGMILLFLFLRSLGAFERAGFGFFTTASFAPELSDHFGIAALLPDSALIAVMATAKIPVSAIPARTALLNFWFIRIFVLPRFGVDL